MFHQRIHAVRRGGVGKKLRSQPEELLLFRLCVCGVGSAAHPDELRDRLDSRQISEWMAYEMIEPFGPRWNEVLHGIRTAAIVSCFSKPGQQVEATDFMPSHVEPEMTWQEIARNLSGWKDIT